MDERAHHLLQNYHLFDVPATKHKTPRRGGAAWKAPKINKRSGYVKDLAT
jgi:hypothetical protein